VPCIFATYLHNWCKRCSARGRCGSCIGNSSTFEEASLCVYVLDPEFSTTASDGSSEWWCCGAQPKATQGVLFPRCFPYLFSKHPTDTGDAGTLKTGHPRADGRASGRAGITNWRSLRREGSIVVVLKKISVFFPNTRNSLCIALLVIQLFRGLISFLDCPFVASFALSRLRQWQ
jgi:hypothetical protein